jgi:hypothetical protein
VLGQPAPQPIAPPRSLPPRTADHAIQGIAKTPTAAKQRARQFQRHRSTRD